jgi:hypothetical protein
MVETTHRRRAAAVLAAIATAFLPHTAAADTPAAPRMLIEDAITAHAVRMAIAGASEWLAAGRCQAVFEEFRDASGRVLSARLADLGTTGHAYVGLVLFLDDPQTAACGPPGRLAYTSPGSRVAYVCGRDFERAWRTDPRQATAAIVHEILHSLGLRENPPSPRHITHRVIALCGR